MFRLTIKEYVVLLMTALTWGACAKSKPNFPTSGNLVTSQQIVSSSARIVNLDGYTDIAVNGQPLTDMLFQQTFGEVIYPSPTPFFPTTGKMGQTYKIPQQFFNAQHTAEVELLQGINTGTLDTLYKKFQVTDDYAQPNDYYDVPYRKNIPPSLATLQITSDSVFVIPRPISPAADPTHFLIRILNLSSGPDAANLVGGMRLAYANGAHVATGAADTLTIPGNYSGYIELPYGTYQFKVLTAQNAQVPSAQQDVVSTSAGLSLTEATGTMSGSPLTYAPIITYQPGGVYTIVVNTNNDFQVPYGNGGLPSASNSFWVIPDITPGANVTYAHLQVANAVPGSDISITVDGQPLGGSVAFPGAGAYQVYVSGTHQVQVTDKGGQIMAQKTLTLNGGDNITAWVYPGPGGADSILPVQNNLSGSWYSPTTGGDGSSAATSQYHTYYPFWIRFLNLCPDLPLVTFTQANGQLFPDNIGYGSSALAAQNLAPGGLPDTYLQYVASFYTMPAQIQVYQSQPLVLPGDWLSDIPALTPSDFVNSTAASYPYGLPTSTGEPGVYTVALVGTGAAAQMIIVKHNQ
ncbi:DUF4397 domain-containing protein [Dinghuibacter silviterrae]|uniref:DUF4397 domain-containing protein n=1 Tax=Dinghuibacter silviterrae TaxID=1539049 RepID=A0A4R8DTL2_9BACT|nr:DUF4397 domain-containing protein [Dinghuibacter silviterrae]TDX00757.1 hypothetical protein EDB95_1785 [Dinghuibacter silviterrae]